MNENDCYEELLSAVKSLREENENLKQQLTETGPLMPFGMYKGRPIKNVPTSYAEWLLGEMRGSLFAKTRPTNFKQNLLLILDMLTIMPYRWEDSNAQLLLLEGELGEDAERTMEDWLNTDERRWRLLAWAGWQCCERLRRGELISEGRKKAAKSGKMVAEDKRRKR